MLAINRLNRRLGHEPFVERRVFAREL